jgi:hypothetical protein
MTIQSVFTTAVGGSVPGGYRHILDQAVAALTQREERIAREIVRLGREAGLAEADILSVLQRAVEAAETPVTAQRTAPRTAPVTPGVDLGHLRSVAQELRQGFDAAFSRAAQALGL